MNLVSYDVLMKKPVGIYFTTISHDEFKCEKDLENLFAHFTQSPKEFRDKYFPKNLSMLSRGSLVKDIIKDGERVSDCSHISSSDLFVIWWNEELEEQWLYDNNQKEYEALVKSVKALQGYGHIFEGLLTEVPSKDSIDLLATYILDTCDRCHKEYKTHSYMYNMGLYTGGMCEECAKDLGHKLRTKEEESMEDKKRDERNRNVYNTYDKLACGILSDEEALKIEIQIRCDMAYRTIPQKAIDEIGTVLDKYSFKK